MVNEDELKSRIALRGLKLQYIAEQLEITYQALLNKVTGRSEFKTSEVAVLRRLLELSDEETAVIFFAENVERQSTEEG